MGAFLECSTLHGVEFLHYSGMFIIHKSIVNMVLWEIICVINFVFKNQIKWPKWNNLIEVMFTFKKLYGLPSIHGVYIDAIQIYIQKLWGSFVGNYIFLKSKTYNMQLQTMVDCWRTYLRIVLWAHLIQWTMFGYLGLSNLYYKVITQDLLHVN